MAPYFLWNLVSFGHLLTTSGTVKLDVMGDVAAQKGGWLSSGYLGYVKEAARATVDRGLAVATPVLGGDSRVESLVGVAAIAAAAVTGWVGYRAWKANGAVWTPAGVAVASVAALILSKSMVDHALLPVWAGTWYAVPFYTLIAVTLGAGLGSALQRLAGHWNTTLLLWVAVAVAVPLTARLLESGELDGHHLQAAYALAIPQIDEVAPEGTIGAYDAGLIGYELHPRPVVNLDGLVNDFDHADALASDTDAAQLIRDAGVDIVIGRFLPEDRRLPDCATILWESPHRARYRDIAGDGGISEAAVVIASMETCN